MPNEIRILSEADLRGIVSLDLETVEVIEAGFRALAGGGVRRGCRGARPRSRH